MGSCSRTPLSPRRRTAVIAASTASLAATLPLLLRPSGTSDWSDALLGGVIGIALGVTVVFLGFTLRRLRNST